VRRRFEVTTDANVRYVAAPEEIHAVDQPPPAAPAVTRLAAQYARETTPLSGLEATLLAALGAKAEDGSDLATDVELQEPFAALALTRLAAPAIAPLLPEDVVAGLGRLRRAEPFAPGAGEPDVERMARMEEDLADLRKKVGAQSRTITNLRKQMGKR